MRFFYQLDPDPGKVARGITRQARGARRAGMINATTTIEAIARRNAPVRTSNLANSGTSEVNAAGTQGIVRFTAPYSVFVHEGTGLFGPHKTKIVPISAKALYWPGAAHPVRAVKGMHGHPFLTDAAEQSDIAALYATGAANYLAHGGT